MYIVMVKIKYEYAHRLIYHQGNCRNIHGHSGEAQIELAGDNLNNNGFVIDFGEIKSFVKKWIKENWDHAYLANENDFLLPILRDAGMKVFSFTTEPSAEVMAKFLFEQVLTMNLQDRIRVLKVTIKETCTGYASYNI